MRLFTVGVAQGFRVYLPDRTFGPQLANETRNRIQMAEWVVCFSMGSLAESVHQELDYAFQTKHDRSRIIVVYDRVRNLEGPAVAHFSEFFFDANTMQVDELISQMLKTIGTRDRDTKERERLKSENKALKAFLLAGLGILAISALSSEPGDRPKKRSTTKKRTSKRRR
ncbi:MAG: hypothetical protein K1X75_15165 [Leptospirales bacterium]|nr:hypothetical protein [Leptospirales bacterium]